MKCLLSVLFGLSLLLAPVANVSGAEQTETSILQTAVGQNAMHSAFLNLQVQIFFLLRVGQNIRILCLC